MHALVHLGEFTRDHQPSCALRNLRKIVDRLLHPVRRLEEHQRGRNRVKFANARTPGFLLGRQETAEHHRLLPHACHRERCRERARAGNRRHPATGRPYARDQARSGIGNRRGAGIRDERDALAVRHPLQHRGEHLRLVVFVQGEQLARDSMPVEQLGGDPRVLGENHIGPRKHRKRAQGHVLHVTDGRGHHI